MSNVKILQGDAIEQLRSLEAESITTVLTDPPYEIGYMGREWDSTGIAFNPELWGEVHRVLRPGGQVLAFGHARTYHRLAVALEDQGFEIRTSFAYLTTGNMLRGSDISKTIDRQGRRADAFARRLKFAKWVKSHPEVTTSALIDAIGGITTASHFRNESQPSIPTPEQWVKIRPLFPDVPEWVDEEVETRGGRVGEETREPVGERIAAGRTVYNYAPATPAAQQWHGHRSAIRSLFEPAVVARKRLFGDNLADNVIEHGTGVFDLARNMVNGLLPGNVAVDAQTAEDLDIPIERQPFFLASRAPRAERVASSNGVTHDTVKPLSLMRHLVRLMVPEGGVVLDPFAGSGSTLVAAQLEGRKAVGIELNEEYVDVIRRRLEQ